MYGIVISRMTYRFTVGFFIYVYNLRMCWKKVCRALLESLQDDTSRVGADWQWNKFCKRPWNCLSSVTTILFMSCHTSLPQIVLHSFFLRFYSHIAPPTQPNTPTILWASLSHNYIFKIWPEGKCFSVKVCLLRGFLFSFDLIFPNNSFRGNCPEWWNDSP